MNTFLLHLQSGECSEKIEQVASFIGRDTSGSFGLLAGHERMMTILDFGLTRFQTSDGKWHYIALPGGVLYFLENDLFISTHRYIRSDDYNVVSAAISDTLAREEEELHAFKSSVSRMEQEMTRRLWTLRREEI